MLRTFNRVYYKQYLTCCISNSYCLLSPFLHSNPCSSYCSWRMFALICCLSIHLLILLLICLSVRLSALPICTCHWLHSVLRLPDPRFITRYTSMHSCVGCKGHCEVKSLRTWRRSDRRHPCYAFFSAPRSTRSDLRR